MYDSLISLKDDGLNFSGYMPRKQKTIERCVIKVWRSRCTWQQTTACYEAPPDLRADS